MTVATVDFSLTNEQVLLRDSVARYVADHGTVERHRRVSLTDTGYEPAAWASFAELGWLALPFPEAHGGLGGSVTDLMVLCEALGRGLIREPYLHTVVTCGGLLDMMGNAAQRETYLAPLMAGKHQWAFAGAEQATGYAQDRPDTSARPAGGAWVLDGRKYAVLNGHAAHYLLVTARQGSGISLFIVDTSSSGVERETFTAVDGSRGAHIQLTGVRVPKNGLLGQAGAALAPIEAVLDRALVALGADALGAMQVLLETTLEYCKTREQFGQPIGKFQSLQHRMADMYLRLEEARSLLYNAAIAVQHDTAQAPAACAALKVKIAEAGRAISYEAVQMHGGIGMTDELVVGHLFKRLLLLSKLFGDGDYYLERYIALST